MSNQYQFIIYCYNDDVVEWSYSSPTLDGIFNHLESRGFSLSMEDFTKEDKYCWSYNQFEIILANRSELFSIPHNYPLLYRRCKHLEVPYSWGPIIDKLSAQLEREILNYMIANPNARPDSDHDDVPCALQVKEKFGGLRFYMSYATETMDALIKEAEKEIWELEKSIKVLDGNADIQYSFERRKVIMTTHESQKIDKALAKLRKEALSARKRQLASKEYKKKLLNVICK